MVDSLKVNQIIEIEVEEGNEYAGSYRTRIEDINEKGIVVAMPIVQGNLVPLRPETQVIIWYWDNIATYAYYCQVKARAYEPLPLLFLSLPFAIKRVQRRKYVRVPTNLKIEYSLKNGKKEEIIYNKAILRDLSGGGAQLIVNDNISKGTKINIKLYLPKVTIECQGKVRWVEDEIKNDRIRYLVGIEFVNISEREREKIIKYIFARQRELIKKGVL